VSVGTGNWVMRMNTGGQRTSDYSTARERIENSAARTLSGGASLARYSDKGWFSMAYNTQRGTYKIPPIELEAGKDGDDDHHHEDVQLPFTRHAVRFTGGLREMGKAIEGLNYSLNYSDWRHDEVGGGEVETQFFNKQVDYRLVMDQRRKGRLSGSFGFWGLNRQYKAEGEEAYLPEVSQNSFAGFALETLQFERARVQFGGRVENVRYAPETGRARNFTGFSGSAGVSLPLWHGGAFVTNFNHSFRAPALEELYAKGPHVGNLTYEIGRADLRRERNNGLDFSVRHSGGRLRAEWNAFYYRLANYVYLAPTGDIEDGLIEAKYSQADARYAGVDAKVQYAVARNVWVQGGLDAVDAELRVSQLSLPRIPPVRGRAGVDFRFKNFSLNPEIIVARRQESIFTTETETAGYATGNLRAGYTYATQHALHLFSVNWFNANNAYYRNHLSFIKDFAAEVGRGVAFSYTVRFY
jgi:iron complex outermembrane recepter protein